MATHRATDGLTPACLGCLLGTASQLQQPQLLDVGTYALGLLLGAALLYGAYWQQRQQTSWLTEHTLPPRTAGHWLLVCASVSLLVFSLCGWRAVYIAAQTLNPSLEGQDMQVVGVVAAMPQQFEDSVRFRLDVEQARLHGQIVPLPAQVLLGWYGGSWGSSVHRRPPELRAGDRWQMNVRLKAPHGQVNPHGFDFELWLWEQGLGATGYVRAGTKDPAPVYLGNSGAHWLERWRQSSRDRVERSLSDKSVSGVVVALLVGDQAAIDKADWDVFRATGVAHLVSISGLHVTLFAWLCGAMVNWLWRQSGRLGRSWCLTLSAPQAGRWAGVLLALGYALFSGWGIPAQRTVMMLVVVAALSSRAQRWPWPQVWLAACAVVLLLDPWALMQAGFWLSFVAVGVLFASGAGATTNQHGWRARLWVFLREQWVVTLCLTPLVLLLFQQASLVGLLANLFAIPWVTVVITPLCLLGMLLPFCWELAALNLAGLSFVLKLMAEWPWAVWSSPAPPVWATAAAVLGGILCVVRLPLGMRLLGPVFMLPAVMWTTPRPAAGELEVWFADIGQGNAVLVRTAQHSLLFDAGPRYSKETDAGQRVLVPLLRAWGERLDALVLSHSDSDHTGGAAAVLAAHPQAQWWGSLSASHPLHALKAGQACAAGQAWHWDGVAFEFLHPLPLSDVSVGKPNAWSCVLRISAQGQTVLLTGDIEAAQEHQLITRDADKLKADLLLVPHHGSNTSSTYGFLQATAPRIAWVQAGYRNRYGHPTAQVMARYQSLNIAVVQGVHCGAGRWQSAQPDQVYCERADQARYWRHRAP